MVISRALLACSLITFLGACSSSEESDTSESPSVENPDPGPSPTVTPVTPAESDWSLLVDGEWTLPAGGEEPELCFKKTVTEDLYVRGIRPIHPPGTHHTLLSQSDGSTGCNASLAANSLIYAAGVGSEGLIMPEGVAMKLTAGTVLGLGLHLYNPSTEEITGRSGMEAILVPAEEVENLAEAVLAGPFNISIPPGEYTQSGECVLGQEQTIVAIFPHMHQLGTHFRASFVVGGTEHVVHDAPYSFEEQYQIVLDEPLLLAPGDSVVTECTWQNPTNVNVGFGESSDTEMCFNVMFQYPARGTAFCGGSLSGGMRPDLGGPACVAADAPGNELGIGKYCERDSGVCTTQFCLADYVDGEIANFCTGSCMTDADCGTGATCQGSAGRAVCFPDACAGALSGLGGDAGADAG